MDEYGQRRQNYQADLESPLETIMHIARLLEEQVDDLLRFEELLDIS